MNRIKPTRQHTRDFRVRRPLKLEEYSYHKIVDGMFASIGWDVGLRPREFDSLGVSLLSQQILTRIDTKSKKLRDCSSLLLRSSLRDSLPPTATEPVTATVLRAFTYQPMQHRTYIGLEIAAPEIEAERSVLNQTLMQLADVEYYARECPLHITLGTALDGQRLEESLTRVHRLVEGELLLQPIAFAKGV